MFPHRLAPIPATGHRPHRRRTRTVRVWSRFRRRLDLGIAARSHRATAPARGRRHDRGSRDGPRRVRSRLVPDTVQTPFPTRARLLETAESLPTPSHRSSSRNCSLSSRSPRSSMSMTIMRRVLTTTSSRLRSPTSRTGGPKCSPRCTANRSRNCPAGCTPATHLAHQRFQGVTRPSTSYPDLQAYVAFYCEFGDFMAYDDGQDGLLLPLADRIWLGGDGRRTGARVWACDPGSNRGPRTTARHDRHRTAGRLLRRSLDRPCLPRRIRLVSSR